MRRAGHRRDRRRLLEPSRTSNAGSCTRSRVRHRRRSRGWWHQPAAPRSGRRLGGRGGRPRGRRRPGAGARGDLGPVAVGRRPDVQCSGVGRGCSSRAPPTRTARRGRIILASPDPRACGAYARLGLDAHPCVSLGAPARCRAARADGRRRRPPAHRGGRPRARGAAHGERHQAMLGRGTAGRARARLRGRRRRALRCSAAFDDEGARELPGRAGAASASDSALPAGSRPRQQWAVTVCWTPGWTSAAPTAAAFTGGDVGPLPAILPSGAFL